MASEILKKFLLNDIVNIITGYNLPDRKEIYEKSEDVISNLFLVHSIHRDRPNLNKKHTIRVTQCQAFCVETNKFIRKNMYHFPHTHRPNFYKLNILFNDPIYRKMLRLLKKYKTFKDIYNYENSPEYKYLLNYTKGITQLTKNKQEIYNKGSCIAINKSNHKECKYKRKYEFYCGRHQNARNVFDIFDVLNNINGEFD